MEINGVNVDVIEVIKEDDIEKIIKKNLPKGYSLKRNKHGLLWSGLNIESPNGYHVFHIGNPDFLQIDEVNSLILLIQCAIKRREMENPNDGPPPQAIRNAIDELSQSDDF